MPLQRFQQTGVGERPIADLRNNQSKRPLLGAVSTVGKQTFHVLDLSPRRTCGKLDISTGQTMGCMNTKLHAVTDNSGRPVRFFITACQVNECNGGTAFFWLDFPGDVLINSDILL